MRRYETVTFLSDHGTGDESVGVVRCVVRDLAPDAVVIDLTHAIPPRDTRAGGLALARAISYVPDGVVLAAVDVGLGSAQRGVAVVVADGAGVLIGPDNGVLAPAVAMAGGAERAVELTNPAYQLDSAGSSSLLRDVLAPAAAHLCSGVPVDELGDPVDPGLLVPGTVPLPRVEDDELVCEVLWVDRFGAVQLNIGPDDVPADWSSALQARCGSPSDPNGPTVRRVRRIEPSGDLAGAGVGLLLDPTGMLALVAAGCSAADDLSVAPGDQVVLVDLGDDATDTTVPVELTKRARHVS